MVQHGARIRLARERVLKLMGIPQRYAVGGVDLELPTDHRLAEYQRAHRRYDRFLTVLARQLSRGDTAVDVGANVGDTVAGLLQGQPGLQVVAVEADQEFFNYLERNVQTIKQRYPDSDISLVRSLVAASTASMSLAGANGSKHAVPSSGTDAMRPRTLDAIFADLPSRYLEGLRLLKSDVDGFDYDVINSAAVVVAAAKPLIYFECQPDDQPARNKYMDTVERLLSSGYKHLYLFDNFGNPVLRTSESDVLSQCIDSILDQERGTRTIFYLDVLLATDRDRELAETAVAQHRLA